MKRNLHNLISHKYDLVIVGGGIFGVCAAWEAASRGFSVALVEKGDFCQATSANHYKFVHGGIRYLQHADLSRVRESCRERSVLLRIAPHLVRPIPIVIPTYGHGTKGKAFLRAGFVIYDLLTSDRNIGLSDPGQQVPNGKFISRNEVLERFPGLSRQGLTGGAILHEGQYYNPPRLAISFLRSAVEAGAIAGNYLEATGFLVKHNRVLGVSVQDLLTQNSFEIHGKTTLIAAGPWCHRLLKSGIGLQMEPEPTFSRDLAFVVRKSLATEYALACAMKTGDQDSILNRGGRHVFLSPWRGHTLIGVWHKVFSRPPDEISVDENELQGFVDEVNDAYPALSLSLNDVTMINTGLTLFGSKERQGTTKMSFGKRSWLIDHSKEDHVEGLLTLIGVRATTARGVAEKAMNLVSKKLGRKTTSNTRRVPIFGGKITCFDELLGEALKKRPSALNEKEITALVHNYGAEYPGILKYAEDDPMLTERIGDSTTIKAEVKHAVREEMAQKLSDVVFRRTDLGTAGDPGEKALATCAELTAVELGWTRERIARELEMVKAIFQRRGFLSGKLQSRG